MGFSDKDVRDANLGEMGISVPGSTINELTYVPPGLNVPSAQIPSTEGQTSQLQYISPQQQEDAKQYNASGAKKENSRRWSTVLRISKSTGFSLWSDMADALLSRTNSYLTVEGRIRANSRGDLGSPEPVKKSEHLRRLSLAYERYHQARMEKYRESDIQYKRNLYEESKIRVIQCQSENLYLSPLSNFVLYQGKTGGSYVNILKYDDLFRLFIRWVFIDGAHHIFGADYRNPSYAKRDALKDQDGDTVERLCLGEEGKPLLEFPIRYSLGLFFSLPGEGVVSPSLLK